jgi:uncharacterized membrane protein YoaK (UPF0700 family)
MSSLDIAASPQIRRDEAVQILLLLAFAGGYLDAYTWIIHGVMANAQTANLVLLWVHGSVGEWDRAVLFVPPIAGMACPWWPLLIVLLRCEIRPDEALQ